MNTVEAHAYRVLSAKFDNFVPWLLSNGGNPIWAERSVGQEVARVMLATLEQAGLMLVEKEPS